jgi:acetyl esterase/lipase
MNERNSEYEVDIQEVEYLKHGEKPLLARIFIPRGKGTFPAVVEAHGGAWCIGTRANNDSINAAIAKGGVVVAALDFRGGPEATYPSSVADINYGVRWLKSQAEHFKTRPELVGSMGTSSGGHLAILSALKPSDPRYAAVTMPGASVDARVAYVVALWPVICPLGRYLDHRANATGDLAYANPKSPVRMQEGYWLTEEAMGEGSPTLALERGDAVELPNLLYLQNPEDVLHPRENLERFVTNYRKRGGNVQLEFFEGPAYDQLRSHPSSESAKQGIKKIIKFIQQQTAPYQTAA